MANLLHYFPQIFVVASILGLVICVWLGIKHLYIMEMKYFKTDPKEWGDVK
jgi:hypothetical protein